MGTRHITSSKGVRSKLSDLPPSWHLVSMSEYVSDLGLYDSQTDDEEASLIKESKVTKAKNDVDFMLGGLKKGKKH